ncbi:hypothetical protein L6E12_31005 [Actinokineospora sp. PR83]|uniref:hypothetical protein n=1 Tax=Actinokineospora sp. PR83 TaxID=2884908 RepID=UPI001F1E4D59|nr:hypothetical protein [Actinokineospora sp. PR83]MCG8920210.1 hypothetical protein [Actinokineospora sp. PR83]
MTGYRADPGELATASARLRDTADTLAEVRLDADATTPVGPPDLAAALTAFTTEARSALTTTTSAITGAAAGLRAADNAYTDTEADVTAALTRHLRD